MNYADEDDILTEGTTPRERRSLLRRDLCDQKTGKGSKTSTCSRNSLRVLCRKPVQDRGIGICDSAIIQV